MSSYISIASQTLGSSASSVTFSSIPTTLNGKTLRDLVLVAEARADGGNFDLRLNADSGSNYAQVEMVGNGSSTSSSAYTTNQLFLSASGMSLTTSISAIAQILDFAQTNKHKSILVRGDLATGTVMAKAGRYVSTSAITSITVQNTFSPFTAGSTFSLYGIEG